MFPWFFSIHAIHKSRSATSPFDCQRGRGKSLNLWKIGAVQIILNNLKAYQTISNHLKFSKTILKHLKCKSSTIIWGVLPTIHPLFHHLFPQAPQASAPRHFCTTRALNRARPRGAELFKYGHIM